MAALMLVALAAGPLRGSPALAQTPASVAPLAPPDGAVVGPQPVFEIEYAGIDDSRLRDSRFRIVLRRDGVRGEAYRFDQMEQRTGWLPGERGRMIYRPRRPLQDGSYSWQVDFWNGARWIEGDESPGIRVDTVPPAEIDGLRVLLTQAAGEVLLSWDPVVFDRDGQPEYVARYRVLRYVSAPPWPVARAFEVGETPDPAWEEPLDAKDPGLVLYRVIAVDEAGNAGSGRR